MPFNINDFNSAISKTGYGRTNFFEGFILGGPGSYIPGGGNQTKKYGSDETRFRIESVNLPGRNLLTLDQRYHGPVRQLPYLASYQPCTMTIILSQDYREREMFMRWQDFMVGHYRTAYNRSDYEAQFDSKYYDEGIGTVMINVYSNSTLKPSTRSRAENYETQYSIILEEAFPISVNDIAMSWGDEGYARLNVEMRYRYTTEVHKTFSDQTKAESDRQTRAGGGFGFASSAF